MGTLLTPLHALTRRHFFRDCAVGLGKIALASLLSEAWSRGADQRRRSRLAEAALPGARRSASSTCSWPAGPSQLELFDYKPELQKLDGKPIPESFIAGQAVRVHDTFAKEPPKLLGHAAEVRPARPVRRVGRPSCCRTPAKVVDDIAFVKSVCDRAVQPRPGQAVPQHRLAAVRPAEHGRVGDLRPRQRGQGPARLRRAAVRAARAARRRRVNWGSGFLPTVYQGVPFRSGGEPILDVASPPGHRRRSGSARPRRRCAT